jgi:prepilin-type N-terminal cleavage/methylation domain-containing protein
MNQRGFSLLEVLVGLVVLAFGLLATAGMQLSSIQGNHFSSDLTQATVRALNKLEELKNLPYSDPKLNNPQPAQQITVSGIVYTVLYNVSAPGNWMKLITTDVRWTDRGNHQVTLSTIKSR